MIEQPKDVQFTTNDSSNLLSQLIELMKPLHVLLSQNSYVKDTTKRIKRIIDDASSPTTILIMGKERVGKTTLINALLGYELLPASSEHPTAANTFIRYGEEECVKAVFLDGMVATFDIEKLELFTTSNTFVAQIIREYLDYIEVYIDHDLLKTATIVDTIALEATANHLAYFSEILLGRVDEILWVIRAGSMATEAEFMLLEKYSKRGIRPHFIVNGLDQHVGDILDFIKAENERYGEHIASMLAVSAKLALEGSKMNDAQRIAHSQYSQFYNLISNLAKDNAKKTPHIVERFIDWLQRFCKEVEYIPQREPYLSAVDVIGQYTDYEEFEFTRQQRDMALLTAYEEEYEQVCNVFKSVETLYQLLTTLTSELYLRDEMVEEFEHVSLSYQQAVREYRKLHVEYMQVYGLLDQQCRKLFGKGIEKGNLQQLNENATTKRHKSALDSLQSKCEEQFNMIKYYESIVVANLPHIQNHLNELAQKRLQGIIKQVAEINVQRKQEVKAVNSYVDKLSEFNCIQEAQRFIQNTIKPYLLSGSIELTEEQRATIENTIECIIAVNLSLKDTVLPLEENEQDVILHHEFDLNYVLSPLKLVEADVISDIPELPAALEL